VSRIQIIRKMGLGTILKNKIFCRDQKHFFFYRDQTLNEAYFQGRVQYLSLNQINISILFRKVIKKLHIQFFENKKIVILVSSF